MWFMVEEGLAPMKRIFLVAIPTLLFAGGGFAYYHYVGCNSGACPIASSPVVSTVFGAVIGASVGLTISDGRKKSADL